MQQLVSLFVRLSRPLFWLAATFAVVMAVLPKPPELLIDRFGDKFEHMLAFAVLSWLAGAAYPATPRLRLLERLSFLGAGIEVVQSIPALHRDCDVRDWIADTLAAALAMGLAMLIARRRAAA